MSEVTRLEARYVDQSKLESLLEEKFGGSNNYSVKTQGDIVEITASRKLTEDEIKSVTTNQ